MYGYATQGRVAAEQFGITSLDAPQRIELVRRILMRDRERRAVRCPLVHPAVGAIDPDAETKTCRLDFHSQRLQGLRGLRFR